MKIVVANMVLQNANLTNEVYLLRQLLKQYEVGTSKDLFKVMQWFANQLNQPIESFRNARNLYHNDDNVPVQKGKYMFKYSFGFFSLNFDINNIVGGYEHPVDVNSIAPLSSVMEKYSNNDQGPETTQKFADVLNQIQAQLRILRQMSEEIKNDIYHRSEDNKKQMQMSLQR